MEPYKTEMPRPKPTDEDLEERQTRRREWSRFRKDFLLTQVKLADVLGISRRTLIYKLQRFRQQGFQEE